MTDSEAKKAWMKDNTTMITMKLNNRTDADILKALEGKQKQTMIKELIRIALALTPEQRVALAETAEARRNGVEWEEAIEPIQEQLIKDGKKPISKDELNKITGQTI